MGILLLVPGIILAVWSSHFTGQHQLGDLLIAIGAVLLVIQLLFMIAAISAANRQRKQMHSDFLTSTRTRRGF